MKTLSKYLTLVTLSILVSLALFAGCSGNNSPTSPGATATPVPPTATPTNSPTATPTNSPCGFPGHTCTFTATSTHTFTPTITSTPTSTFTPTITSTNTPVVPVGIYWESAGADYDDYSTAPNPYSVAYLWQTVNGVPETTDTVLLGGTGIPTPIAVPFAGVSQASGSNYAVYQTLAFTYQPGATYWMKSTTSAGSASATVTNAPGGVTLSSDYSTLTWTNSGTSYDWAGVFQPICSPGSGGCGWTLQENPATSPMNLTPGYTSVYGGYWVQTTQETEAATVYGAKGPSTFGCTEAYLQEGVP